MCECLHSSSFLLLILFSAKLIEFQKSYCPKSESCSTTATPGALMCRYFKSLSDGFSGGHSTPTCGMLQKFQTKKIYLCGVLVFFIFCHLYSAENPIRIKTPQLETKSSSTINIHFFSLKLSYFCTLINLINRTFARFAKFQKLSGIKIF